jgi:hypothetical protein
MQQAMRPGFREALKPGYSRRLKLAVIHPSGGSDTHLTKFLSWNIT